VGRRDGEMLWVFHGALENGVERAGEETAGPEVGFAEGVVVCVGPGGGDVFWVVGWWILVEVRE